MHCKLVCLVLHLPSVTMHFFSRWNQRSPPSRYPPPLFIPPFFPPPTPLANPPPPDPLPDPDLDADSVPLAWDTPAAALVASSPSLPPSNATTGTSSSRAADAFSTSSPFLTMKSTPAMGLISSSSLSSAHACAPNLDGEGTLSSSSSGIGE